MTRISRLLFLVFVAIVIGCEGDKCVCTSARPIQLGEYVGTYTIVRNFEGVTDSSKTCGTEFTLNATSYYIREISYICPPRSYGTYELTPTAIAFRDTAIHTDEFDPSLIPDGAYKYTFDGVNLQMTQFDTVRVPRLEHRQYIYDLAIRD
jgi:hypothetical protein